MTNIDWNALVNSPRHRKSRSDLSTAQIRHIFKNINSWKFWAKQGNTEGTRLALWNIWFMLGETYAVRSGLFTDLELADCVFWLVANDFPIKK